MIETMRLGQINLYVSDLDVSAAFYERSFGFEIKERGDSFRTLRAGDVVLTLFRAHGSAAAPTRGAQPGMTADLLTSDFDETIRRIAEHGGNVGEVETWSSGRFVLFTDPDGIGWELIEDPGQ